MMAKQNQVLKEHGAILSTWNCGKSVNSGRKIGDDLKTRSSREGHENTGW